jgi:hypothetical protein
MRFPGRNEEANQRPFCIPTISQPIHAEAETSVFQCNYKSHFNCRVEVKEQGSAGKTSHDKPTLICEPFATSLLTR